MKDKNKIEKKITDRTQTFDRKGYKQMGMLQSHVFMLHPMSLTPTDWITFYSYWYDVLKKKRKTNERFCNLSVTFIFLFSLLFLFHFVYPYFTQSPMFMPS